MLLPLCLMSGRGDRLRPAQTALDSDAVGTELNEFNGCPSDSEGLRKLGRPDKGCDGGGMPQPQKKLVCYQRYHLSASRKKEDSAALGEA